MVDKTLLNYVEQVYVLEYEQYTLSQIIGRLKEERLKKAKLIKEEIDSSYGNDQGMKISVPRARNKIINGILIFLLYILYIFVLHPWYGFPAFKNELLNFAVLLISFFLIFYEAAEIDSIRKWREEKENAYNNLLNIINNNSKIRAICEQLD